MTKGGHAVIVRQSVARRTGEIGTARSLVLPVESVVRIRTSEIGAPLPFLFARPSGSALDGPRRQAVGRKRSTAQPQE